MLQFQHGITRSTPAQPNRTELERQKQPSHTTELTIVDKNIKLLIRFIFFPLQNIVVINFINAYGH